ncbi:DNA segregation ATPase FtsK/SpoIIIE, S-DNA-T family [Thalassolituus maritimus]|uniref:DNA translocase FtsK n=2 Tax=Thalassolituus TaxID=187492 RepID=A0A1N7PYR0_9GAMM|nr:DNA segregation ATPase FtsK/SpoIIIE, S-DNA-T family [Thalassolituus maritimus]
MSSQHSEIDNKQKNMSDDGWRKRHDIGFLLLTLGCVLLFLALISYDPEDVAWSVVGSGTADNSIGRVGAYLADFLLHGLGYLAFAFPALIMAKTWLLFRKAPAVEGRVWVLRASGLLLILISLAALADVSIWRGELLPAGAGGIIGEGAIALMAPLFGFIGSVSILIIALALGLVLFLEFSWLMFFERVGGVALSFVGCISGNKNTDSRSVEKAGATAHDQKTTGDSIFRKAFAFVAKKRATGTQEPGSASKPEVTASNSGLPKNSRLDAQSVVAASDAGKDPLDSFEGFSALDDHGDDSLVSDLPWDVSKPEPGPEAEPKPAPAAQARNEEARNEGAIPTQAVAAREVPKTAPNNDIIENTVADVKSLKIEPLEKRESRPSDRAKRDLQGKLFKGNDPLPSIALLDPPKSDGKAGFSEERLHDLSELLVQKLADFGVKIEVTAVAPGPVITRFEIQPAPGVKASKISNLAKDLARSMAMVAVRVVEVIPGKSVMGIEVPNENRAMVTLGEVLSSEDYDKSKSPLTLALGHDIAGNPVITDLAKMPHLLVAGTTGSGKSVGVNAMLLSLLFKSTPEELRLILVDPKMLELSVYEGIPHLLTPVITDMKEAASGLRWSVAEMERRYQLMAAMGVRNIAGYNKKVKDAIEAGTPLADPLWQIDQSFDTTPPTLEPLPYIVIVVDEFADMMMMVGKKVEELIARIAQKARAAGIHMILATQRPSVDVITGLIKANVPTRIAFQVSSKIDSRTILDQGGAEQLLGHGDMLFMPPGNALPERVHGAFVDDDEVHRVVAEWKQRGEPDYIEEITQVGEDGSVPGMGGDDADGEKDDLYDQAVAFVTESGKCSISSVQRKLRIGYNRAARLVETMEAAGVVSPPAHNGSREVIAPPPA